MRAGFDLRLSCWSDEEFKSNKSCGKERLVLVRVKQLKMKTDWRYGREKMSEGNIAVLLQVGYGGLPKSSLET